MYLRSLKCAHFRPGPAYNILASVIFASFILPFFIVPLTLSLSSLSPSPCPASPVISTQGHTTVFLTFYRCANNHSTNFFSFFSRIHADLSCAPDKLNESLEIRGCLRRSIEWGSVILGNDILYIIRLHTLWADAYYTFEF